jgi:hypothetical protein
LLSIVAFEAEGASQCQTEVFWTNSSPQRNGLQNIRSTIGPLPDIADSPTDYRSLNLVGESTSHEERVKPGSNRASGDLIPLAAEIVPHEKRPAATTAGRGKCTKKKKRRFSALLLSSGQALFSARVAFRNSAIEAEADHATRALLGRRDD